VHVFTGPGLTKELPEEVVEAGMFAVLVGYQFDRVRDRFARERRKCEVEDAFVEIGNYKAIESAPCLRFCVSVVRNSQVQMRYRDKRLMYKKGRRQANIWRTFMVCPA
jgi:hypothetical protein